MSLSLSLSEFLAAMPGHDDEENRVDRAMAILEKAGIKSVAVLAGADAGELKLPLTGPESEGNAGGHLINTL